MPDKFARFCLVCGNELMRSGRVAGDWVCHPDAHGCGLTYLPGGGGNDPKLSLVNKFGALEKRLNRKIAELERKVDLGSGPMLIG
jgi:hypothetical protein